MGWTVQERIGWTISRLHEPVPLWHQQVAASVSKLVNMELCKEDGKLTFDQVFESPYAIFTNGTVKLLC